MFIQRRHAIEGHGLATSVRADRNSVVDGCSLNLIEARSELDSFPNSVTFPEVRIIAPVTGSLVAELKRRNVLRVAMAYAAIAWLLIQIAETVLPLYGFADSAARMVVTILVIGFIPVVVLAWVFEWTPEGIRRDTKEIPRAPGDAEWLDRLIVITLVIAVSYFAIDKFILDPARDREIVQEAKEEGRQEALLDSYGDKSIAVLPFENMSADPEKAFFGRGLAEEMLNLLARIPELRVISRSSSFKLSDEGLDIPEIAERLDVAHVLEGSVRIAGDHIRVTAQLIEGTTDAHIWSNTWDSEIKDIFAIEDEIADEVVKRLEILLSGDMPRSVRTDPVAYSLFIQAQQEEDGPHKVALLKEALELDPDYVQALLKLNYLSWQMVQAWPFDDEEERETYKRLERETYTHAVDIAPDDPEVLTRRAWEAFEIHQDWPAAARLFERATEIDPHNYGVLSWLPWYALMIDRVDIALQFAERGMSIDPLCWGCAYQLMRLNYLAGRFTEALHWNEAFQEKGGRGGFITLGKTYLLLGKPELALQAFDKQQEDEITLPGKVMALHDLGRHQEARALFEDLASRDADAGLGGIGNLAAQMAAWIGETDKAFEWLELAFGDNDYRHFPIHYNDPMFKNLHGDPRWQALLRKVNLTDEQKAAIRFNPHLPE